MRRGHRGSAVIGLAVLAMAAQGCGTQPATNTSPSAEASAGALLPTTMTPADEAPDWAIVISLGPGPVFEPENVTGQGEALTFFLDASEINEGSAHNFTIGPELPPAAPLAESDFIQRGESAVFTVTGLAPGTYAFWCSVEEHHSLGMTGTLVVEP